MSATTTFANQIGVQSNSIFKRYRFCGLLCLVLAAFDVAHSLRAASPAGDVVGKLTVGYQGWFACTRDGAPINSWWHWSGTAQPPTPGTLTNQIHCWPDVRQFTHAYQTALANFGNGQPATLFSSYDDQTVQTHFRWMAENAIDTAALQRFNPTGFQCPRSSRRGNQPRPAAIELAAGSHRLAASNSDQSARLRARNELGDHFWFFFYKPHSYSGEFHQRQRILPADLPVMNFARNGDDHNGKSDYCQNHRFSNPDDDALTFPRQRSTKDLFWKALCYARSSTTLLFLHDQAGACH